jgi:hypothetical protein
MSALKNMRQINALFPLYYLKVKLSSTFQQLMLLCRKYGIHDHSLSFNLQNAATTVWFGFEIYFLSRRVCSVAAIAI